MFHAYIPWYIDKPMKNHTLLQAIARVNRVYKDKPGGLIVDYIGIADDLRKSLAKYTLETIGQFFTDIKSVIAQLKEEYDIVSSKMSTFGVHRLDWLMVSKRFPWNAKYEAVYRWLTSFIVIYTIIKAKEERL
jgi:type I site-specific restriction-modification system R (restriction) subunit